MKRFVNGITAFLMCVLTDTSANPLGEQVILGDASFARHNQQLSIRQLTDRAIINWQDFSIKKGETTQFYQPSSNAAILNRVLSSNPSALLGTLQANGHVYLINPNGIVVGAEGQINAQSFIASTLDVKNADFMSKSDLQFSGNSRSAIINLGHIDAAGGDVYLIAQRVENVGSIAASGHVGLAGGNDVLLTVEGDERISIRLNLDSGSVDNAGLIEAAHIEMKAVANNPYALAVNNGGIIRATGVTRKNGRVILSASQGTTEVSGFIEAAEGSIKVLGDHVTLKSGSLLDTSGESSGGTVLVGGNYHGQGSEQTAMTTTLEDNVSIKANAIVNGDGGRVIVWADDYADVNGAISVRGGALGGDGGFIETSGKNSIDFSVDVDASAVKGESGLWLIDPANLVINRTKADAIEKALDKDTNVLVTTYTEFPLIEDETVTDIEGTELIATTVNLLEPGNIEINASITKRISNQEIISSYEYIVRGDVPTGALIGELSEISEQDLVYLIHTESAVEDSREILTRALAQESVSSLDDFTIVEIETDHDLVVLVESFTLGVTVTKDRSVVHRSFAEAKVLSDSSAFILQEIPTGLDVVLQITETSKEGTNVPILEFLAPEGSIEVNANIVSLNGALNVVLNAGSDNILGGRAQTVNINANILTNGGDLLVHAPASINVKDDVLLSTRAVYGDEQSEIRFLSSSSETERNIIINNRDDFTVEFPSYTQSLIADSLLNSAHHNTAITTTSSGDINFLVDKQLGFSNFYLFYRSDISSINIGSNVNLLAQADSGRDGSIRLLSVANLTDGLENVGFLAVNNYVDSKITIASGTQIKGGVIDIIADAQSSADVGSLIDTLAREAGELITSATESDLTATIQVDDSEEGQAASSISNLGVSGAQNDASITALGLDTSNNVVDVGGTAASYQVPEIDLGNLPVVFAISSFASDLPVIGDFLSLSPFAIALSEALSTVDISSNVSIVGDGLVTIRANAEANAFAKAQFPGLALSLAYTDAQSNVLLGSDTIILSNSANRYEKSDSSVSVTQFNSLIESSGIFSLDRDFLTERNTDSAVDISSTTTTSVSLKVVAATVDNDAANEILGSTTTGVNDEGQTTRTDEPLDSPIDVAVGIVVVNNQANLQIDDNAEVTATHGDVGIKTKASNSVSSKVIGGKVISPPSRDDDSGEVSSDADAADIANIAIAVQYVNVDVNSRVDGDIEGEVVDITASSSVSKNLNTATAENGFAGAGETPDTTRVGTNNNSSTSNSNSNDSGLGILEFGAALTDSAQEITNSETGSNNQDLGIAGSVALSINTYEVNNVIGSTANITSNAAALSVLAEHNSGKFNNSAITGVQQGRKNAIGAGVAVAVLNNEVNAIVEDGAVLRAIHTDGIDQPDNDDQTAISVLAKTTIESPLEEQEGRAIGRLGRGLVDELRNPGSITSVFSDPASFAQSHIGELIAEGSLLTTSAANSYFLLGDADSSSDSGSDTTDSAANSDFSTEVAISGSFGLLTIGNHSKVEIGDALLSVENAASDTFNDIELRAENFAHTILVAGSVSLPTSSSDTATTESAGGNPETGVGGAVNLSFNEISAQVTVKDGAHLETLKGTVYADAASHFETSLIQVAGGQSSNIGVSGTFGLNSLDIKAISTIADGAIVKADALSVNAVTNLPSNNILSGGLSFGGAVGVGAGVGLNILNRTALADVGHIGTGEQADISGGLIEVGSIDVNAAANGQMTIFALAGGVSTGEEDESGNEPGFSGDASTTQTESTDSGTEVLENAGGIGISGSVAINLANATTRANVSVINGVIRDKINVQAVDNIDVTGLSGGAALALDGGVAVAGAASINRIESDTSATVSHVNLFTGYEANVYSSSIGRITGISLGLAVSVSDGDASNDSASSTNAAIAGSFTYNEISNNTIANIDFSDFELRVRPTGGATDSSIEDDDDAVEVIASDGSQITAVAGALSIVATDSGDAAVGAGVAINTMQGKVKASISNSHVKYAEQNTFNKGVAVAANRIAPIYSFAVAGAAGTAKMAVAASISINLIDTRDDDPLTLDDESTGTFAGISNSQLDHVNRIVVESGNESQILSIAGAVAATSGKAAVGGAFSFNEIGGDIISSVSDSTLSAQDRISVASHSYSDDTTEDAPIDLGVDDAIADLDQRFVDAEIAAAADKDNFTAGIEAFFADKENIAEAVIAPVDTLDLFGSQAAIYSLAAAGGGASNVSVFGAGTVNIINNIVSNNISNSSLNTGGDISVLANNAATIRSASGTISISLGVTAIGGAFNYNTLRGETSSIISDSVLANTTGNILIGSQREGIIETVAAGASVGSTSGIQGTASISTFADLVTTQILGSDISSAGALDIASSEKLSSVTAAGAAAGSLTAAIGASVAIVSSETETLTKIGGSDISAQSNLDAVGAMVVHTASEQQHSTIALTAAVSVTVGVAGAIGIKNINTNTKTDVGAGTQINQTAANGDVTISSGGRLALDGSAGAVGVGITGAGVGAGVDVTVVNDVVATLVANNSVINGNNIMVVANNKRDISSLTVAAGGGLVGVAGGVSVVHVNGGDSTEQSREALGEETYIDENGNEQQAGNVGDYANDTIDSSYSGAVISTSSTTPTAGDTVASVSQSVLTASNDITVEASAKHDVDVVSGAAGVGAVGVGAGIASVTYNSDTRSIFSGSANAINFNTIATDQDINTATAYFLTDAGEAAAGQDFDLNDYNGFSINSFAGGAGIAGIGAAISVVNRNNATYAGVKNNSDINATGDVEVTSQRERQTIISAQGAVVGAFTAGAVIAVLGLEGDVTAELDADVGDAANRVNGLTIKAEAIENNDVLAQSAAAGAITITGAVANISGTAGDVSASLGDDSSVYTNRNIVFDANADIRNKAKAAGVQMITLGIGVGVSDAFIGVDVSTDVKIGQRTTLDFAQNRSNGLIARSRINTDTNGFFTDNAVRNLASSEASGGGVSIAAISGSSSVTEQDFVSSLSIGDDVTINASYVTLTADSSNVAFAFARAQALAVGAGAGSANAFNKNATRSQVDIGDNVVLTTNALEIFSDVLHAPIAGVNALSGSVLSSNSVQVANVESDFSEALITIGDGGFIDVLNNFHILARNGLSAQVDAQGEAFSAIQTAADFNANINQASYISDITIGNSTLRGGRTVNLAAGNFLDIEGSADSRATSLAASSVSVLNVDIDSRSTVNLNAGAKIIADAAKIDATFNTNYDLDAVAQGTLFSTATINRDIDSTEQITLATGASIFSRNVTLTAKLVEGNVSSDALQGLGGLAAGGHNNASINNQRIKLDGDIRLTPANAGILDVEFTLGSFIKVNGFFFGTDAEGVAQINGGTRELLSLNVEPLESQVTLDVGESGLIFGLGQIVNETHIFKEVNVTDNSLGNLVINDINLLSDNSILAPVITTTSANTFNIEMVNGEFSNGVINIVKNSSLNNKDLILRGDLIIDKNGAISVITNATNGNIINQGSTLQADSVYLSSSEGSVGSAASAINVVLTGTGANNSFSGNATDQFHANLQLAEVASSTVSIGDINANQTINLNLLARSSQSIFDITGSLTSIGSIVIDAGSDAINQLKISGSVASNSLPNTGDAGTDEIFVNINGRDDVTSNFAGLSSLFGSDVVFLEGINVEGGGVNITSGNLIGDGTLSGVASGLNVTVTNNWADLRVLQIGGIDLTGSETGITINGQTDVQSNDFGSIVINTTGNTNARGDITFEDNHTVTQLILGSDVTASGTFLVNLDSLDILNAIPQIVDAPTPVLTANALVITSNNLNGIGGLGGATGDTPLLVNIGSGGFSAQAFIGVNIQAVEGDFKINQLSLFDPSPLAGNNITIDVLNGSILGDANTQMFSNTGATFTVSNDILLADSGNVNILGNLVLSGDNVSFYNQSDIVLFGDTTFDGDLLLRTESDQIIASGPVNVSGTTSLIGSNFISFNNALNDFVGAVSIDSNQATHAGTRLVDIADVNDLVFGDVSTGFGVDGVTQAFVVNAGGSISQTAAGSVQALNLAVLNAGGDITLNNTGNELALVNVTSVNAELFSANSIDLGNIDVIESLKVTVASGSITDSSQIQVGEHSTFISQAGGSIDLNGTSNQLGNRFSASSSFDINVINNGSLQLDGVTAGGELKVQLNSGSLTDSDAGVVANSIDLRVNGDLAPSEAHDIVLDSQNNDFVFVSQALTDNLTLVTSGSLVFLTPITTTGDLSLDAASLSFSGLLGIEAENLSLITRSSILTFDRGLNVSGDVYFQSADAINLSSNATSNNRFLGAVSLNGAVATLDAVGSVDLGDVNLTGLNLFASNITDSGVVKVSGVTELIVSGDILLDSAANDFNQFRTVAFGHGNVSVSDINNIVVAFSAPSADGLFASQPVNNVLVNAGSISFENIDGVAVDSNILGDAVFIANNGNINTGSSVLHVAGTTSFSASNNITHEAFDSRFTGDLSFDAGNNISFGSRNTDFSSHDLNITQVKAGGNVSLFGLSLTLGTANIDGNFNVDVTSGGTDLVLNPLVLPTSELDLPGRIIATGAVTVGGSTQLTAFNKVEFNHADNDFVGAVNVTDKSKNKVVFVQFIGPIEPLGPLNLSLVDKNNLQLGDIAIDGRLTAVASSLDINGAVNVVNGVNLTATGTGITGTGSLISNVTANLQTVSDVELLNTANDFQSNLNFTGRSLNVNASNTLALGIIQASGDVSVEANDVNATGSLAFNVQNDLHVTATNNITMSRAINVGGNATFNAGQTGLINNTANAISGLVNANSGALTLVNSGAVNIGTMTTTGDLSLTSVNGAITNNASPLTVSGNASFNSSNAALAITNVNNQFTGSVSATAQSIDFQFAQAIDLGVLNALNGDINVNATVINVAGLITASGALDMVASDGSITREGFNRNSVGSLNLEATGDIDFLGTDISGLISAKGHNVSIVNSGGTHLGNVQASGNLSVEDTGFLVGFIQSDQQIVVAGNADFKVERFNGDNKDIVLSNLSNQISGVISFDAEDISYISETDIFLGKITSDNLTIRSVSGGISSDGSQLFLAGFGELTTLTALGDITLTNIMSSEGQLNMSANNISLESLNDLKLGNINVLNDLDIAMLEGGDITGNTNSSIVVAGETTLIMVKDTIRSSIVLDGLQNDFTGKVNAVASHITITDINDIILGDINARGFTYGGPGTNEASFVDEPLQGPGNLNVTSINGGIDGLGVINAANSFFTVADGSNVILNNPLNSFKYTISNIDDFNTLKTFIVQLNLPVINMNISAVSGQVANVSINTQSDLEMSGVDITGDLNITTQGNFSQYLGDIFVEGVGDVATTSPLIADGNITVTANGLIDVSAGGINAGNDALIWSSNNDVTLQGSIIAGNNLTIAAQNVHNNTGSADPLTAGNRWLVYSTRPDHNTNTTGFNSSVTQFGRSFNITDPQLDLAANAPVGNALIYSVTPVLEGLTISPIDQTITYGSGIETDINLATNSGLSGSLTSVVTVNSEAVDAAVFGIDIGAISISDADLQISLNESIVTRSTAGFVNVGSYTDAIVASLISDGSEIHGLAVDGFADLTVNALAVSLGSVTGVDKVYDGTLAANIVFGAANGALAGDDVNIVASSILFNDKNVGIDQLISVTGLSLNGNDSSNYTFTTTSTSTQASITPKTLDVILLAQVKEYDGSVITQTTVNDYFISGFVGSELAQLTANGSFNSKDVDSASNVTVNLEAANFTNNSGGFIASNYSFANTVVNNSSSITATNLSIAANDTQKTYDGLAFNGGSGVTYNGFVNAENANVLSGVLAFAGNAQGAINAGGYTIQANGLTSSNYNINYINGDLTVDAAALTITANDFTKVYDSNVFNGGNGVVYQGFVNNETQAILNGTLGFTGNSQGVSDAGTYAISALGLNADNYDINYIDGSLNVEQAALSIVANSLTKTYDGTAFTGGNGVVINGFVGSEDSSVLSGSLNYGGDSQGVKNAGSYAIAANGLTSSNYNITYTDGTLDINQALLAVSLNDISKTYDGVTAVNTGAGDYTITGFVASESADINAIASYNSQNVLDANTVTANITNNDFVNANNGFVASNYSYAANVQNTNSSITQAALTVTAQNLSKTYDATAFNGGNGVAYTGFVNSENESTLSGELAFAGSSQGVKNVGDYVISSNGLSSDNYSINYVDGTLVINQAALGITATDITKTYDGNFFSGGNGVVYSGFVGAETTADLEGTLRYTGDSQGALNAGSYDIKVTDLTSDNYAITFVSGQLNVEQAALLVTVADATKVYDGAVFNGNHQLSYSGFVAGEDTSVLNNNVVFSGDAKQGINAGSYEIEASGLVANNYDISYSSGILEITQAILNISLNDISKVYDGLNTIETDRSDYTITGLVGSERTGINAIGFFNSKDVVTANQVAVNLSNEHFVNSSNGFILTNYSFEPTQQNNNSSITLAALTVTTQDLTKTYDATVFNGGNGVIYNGFVNGENDTNLIGSLAFEGSSQGAINVGDYIISSNGLISDNYSINYVDGTLVINQAALEITATDITKIYDGNFFSGGNGVVYSGFVGAETIADLEGTLRYTGDSQGALNTGEYQIRGADLTSDNYAITFTNGLLNIEQAALVVSVIDTAKVYDGAVFNGNHQLSYSGFVAGEDTSVLNNNVVFSGDAKQGINTGSYEIEASGLVANNYDISYSSGILEITQAILNISLNDISKVYDGLNTIETDRSDYTITGFVGSESTDINATGFFNSKDVATANQVTVNLEAENFVNNGNGFIASNYNFVSNVENSNSFITQAALTVTAQELTKTYDAITFNADNSVVYTGFVNGENDSNLTGLLALSDNSQGISNVGNYVISLNGLKSDNYSINYVDGTLNINPATLNISLNDLTKVYDGLNTIETVGSDYTITGFVGSESTDINATGLFNSKDVATANQVTVNLTDEHFVNSSNGFILTNYSFESTHQNNNSSISQAALTVTAQDLSRTYDATTFNGENGVVYNGFVNGENNSNLSGLLTFSGSSQGARNVGDYVISSNGLKSDNYSINYVDGTLNINPATLNISLNDLTKVYDGLNTIETVGSDYTITGLVGSESTDINATGLFNSKDVVTANQVTVNLTDEHFVNSSNGFILTNYNYVPTQQNNSSVITLASLTVTAINDVQIFNNQAYSGNNGLLIEGFVENESAAILTAGFTSSGNAQGAIDAGQYVIAPQGVAQDGNYALTYVNGTLDIINGQDVGSDVIDTIISKETDFRLPFIANIATLNFGRLNRLDNFQKPVQKLGCGSGCVIVSTSFSSHKNKSSTDDEEDQ